MRSVPSSGLNWAFREQPTSDYGIDAQAEKLNDHGKAGGKLIALQIKTGASYFRKRGDGYVYYGEERHREYWTNHSLPVFLILHNPETGGTLWQRIERHLIEDGDDGRWAIQIPANQTLDKEHEPYIAAGIASDLPSLRRARLALDLPLIKKFEEHSECYLRVDEWVNKSLNFRGADVVFSEEPDAEADLEIGVFMAGSTIDRFMAVAFPWLDWSLHEYIDAFEGAGEVAVHVLRVELSANNSLQGGDGNDFLDGEDGNDALHGPQHALGRYRVLIHVICPGGERTAEVIGPWAVDGRGEDSVADLLCPEFLRLWRSGEEDIDFPINEELHRRSVRIGPRGRSTM
jgi:Domain of unknown function (DUF4365)/RTX calcium-binding nonapeptide repeat (4 copies)